MYVRPSVRPHKTKQLYWTDFHKITHCSVFPKYIELIAASIKSDNNNGYFTRSSTYFCDNMSPRSS